MRKHLFVWIGLVCVPFIFHAKPLRVGVAGMTHGHVGQVYSAIKKPQQDVIIVGFAEPDKELALSILKKQVEINSLDKKVIFLPKMPYSEMMHYTCNADLGLAIDHNDVINHKLALPNKLFDYIQAQVPILATDLTEVRALIEQYDIGFILENPLTAERLSEKIREIMEMEVERNNILKNNLLQAKEKENWQNELVKVQNIYSNLN